MYIHATMLSLQAKELAGGGRDLIVDSKAISENTLAFKSVLGSRNRACRFVDMEASLPR